MANLIISRSNWHRSKGFTEGYFKKDSGKFTLSGFLAVHYGMPSKYLGQENILGIIQSENISLEILHSTKFFIKIQNENQTSWYFRILNKFSTKNKTYVYSFNHYCLDVLNNDKRWESCPELQEKYIYDFVYEQSYLLYGKHLEIIFID